MSSDDNRHIGEVLENKYELLERLSSKGAVSVYRGQHVDTSRIVAVEILHDSFVSNSDIVKRFDREARACMAIEHENIVDVFDVGRTPWGAPFMVVEYLEGRTLAELIETQGPLDMGTALEIIAPVLNALAAAHEKGFLHRGLTAENIVIIRREDGNRIAKLIDFGRTKFQAEAEAPAASRPRESEHTSEYSAPELKDPLQEVDFRCDLFSAGVIYYEMLAGKRPFPAATTAEGQEAIPIEPNLSHEEAGPNFPKRALPIIERALDKVPTRRYDSGVEMLEEIRLTTLSEPDDPGGTAQFFFPKGLDFGREKNEPEELATLDDGDTKDEELKWGNAYYFEDHTAMYGQKVPRPSLNDVSAKGFIASDAPPVEPAALPARPPEVAEQKHPSARRRSTLYWLYLLLSVAAGFGLLVGGWLLYDAVSRTTSSTGPFKSPDSPPPENAALILAPHTVNSDETETDSQIQPTTSPPSGKTGHEKAEPKGERQNRQKNTDESADSTSTTKSRENDTSSQKISPRDDTAIEHDTDSGPQTAPQDASQESTYAQIVRRQFRARRHLIKKCQDKHLKRNPYSMGGHFTLNVTVGHSGRITDVQVVDDTLEDDAAISCIVKILQPWIYTAPPAASAVVSKTFRFPKYTSKKRNEPSPEPSQPTPSPEATPADSPTSPTPSPKPLDQNPFS